MLQQAVDAVVGRRRLRFGPYHVDVRRRIPARLEDVVEVSSSSKPLGCGPSAQSCGRRCPSVAQICIVSSRIHRSTLEAPMLFAAQGIWDCLAWPILGRCAASTYDKLDWRLATKLQARFTRHVELDILGNRNVDSRCWVSEEAAPGTRRMRSQALELRDLMLKALQGDCQSSHIETTRCIVLG